MSISLEQLNTSIDKEHKELLKKYKKLEEGIEEQLISKHSKVSKKETLKLHLKNDIELLRGKSYKSLLDTIDIRFAHRHYPPQQSIWLLRLWILQTSRYLLLI